MVSFLASGTFVDWHAANIRSEPIAAVVAAMNADLDWREASSNLPDVNPDHLTA